MKVFLSWSGATSKQYAEAFRNWLPGVIQQVKPYFSPDDINKGQRWQSEISGELEESDVGLIFLTRDNLSAPWILFEAGALAKSITKARVMPVLFGVEPTDVTGPLAQFQMTRFEKDEVEKLIGSINSVMGDRSLDSQVMKSVFQKWWPDLEKNIATSSELLAGNQNELRSERDILEEILLRVRSLKPSMPPFALADFAGLLSEGGLLGDGVKFVPSTHPALNHPIDELGLSKRTSNVLKAESVHYVRELVVLSEDELLRLPNLGKSGQIEVKDALKRVGLTLGSTIST